MTELQLSVIYLSQEKNDINDFDFFIRVVPSKDKDIVSISVVPRFSLDKKKVKHIRLLLNDIGNLDAYDILQVLGELKELENIVSDIKLSADEAKSELKELILSKIN